MPKQYRIEETPVEGKPLGRHVNWDDRSLQYRVGVPAEGITLATVRWNREIPVLNQGSLGSCTGNAATGHLGTDPVAPALSVHYTNTTPLVLDENEAVSIYSDAEKLDGGQGYPPEDNGSSGLSVAQVCLNRGLIVGYQHITSMDEAHAAIQKGPFITGVSWYAGFDSPDTNGLVSISGDVRGGHEFECIGYNVTTDLWEFVNSWGDGWGVQGHFFMSSATFAQLLSEDGDATQFVPLGQPAPTPSAEPFLGQGSQTPRTATATAAPNYFGQLTAATVDTITMPTGWNKCEVVNRDGSAEIWYTVNGSTPATDGSNQACRLLPATICTDEVPLQYSTAEVIKLKSTGAPKYAIIVELA